MELRLFSVGWDHRIPNYPIVEHLLFDLVAQTPERELSAPEKIFVLKSSKSNDLHRGYLADVYLACGASLKLEPFTLNQSIPESLGTFLGLKANSKRPKHITGNSTVMRRHTEIPLILTASSNSPFSKNIGLKWSNTLGRVVSLVGLHRVP